ncbi:MAG: type II CRISPR RNA-guided endonuclease Cas9 [Rhodanobacteraceae bacterium]|jgi:CRISPR-associated endonuclease Csn1|nr:type II CRISPR RNA-guided endonuclease Cas9 [Rhodanobacteraceae bacterium]
MARIKYRLALDMGANSLGWCVYRLDEFDEPDKIVRMGSRIFSDGRDPKTLASRAADRRAARQARRRRDRVLKRRHRLMQALIRFGLMPVDAAERKRLQALDPYVLRARGLEEPLTPFELGRALYHLARKRGFRSSRKDARDEESAKETGKVHAAIKALREKVQANGCRTVGEYLARQHAERKSVRARRSSDGQYVLYLQRAMVEEEFDALWAAQQQHHAELLTAAAFETLRDIMLFQRRLKPVEPGRCQFETNQYRARLCAPLQQRFRILQELNHLRVREGISDRALTLEERNRMLDRLLAEPNLVTFSDLAKAAGLRNAKAFNFGRDEKRRGFKGDAVGARFAATDALGESWQVLTDEQRYALAVLVEQADQVESLMAALAALPADVTPAREILKGQHDEDVVLAALASLPVRIGERQARVLAGFNFPDDYGSLSLKALSRIVPELERDVITYDEAVRRAGYLHHSQFHTGEFFMQLPYYGQLLVGYTSPATTAGNEDERQYGRIPNPTVHIGLNQMRQLVNALIKRYGHPHQVVVELTREFGASGDRRREIEKKQAEAQARNERDDAELERLGVRVGRENRLKLQLWEELGRDDAMDRYCVYSGQRLSKALLFSDEVEIDHVLPFSRTLHDGIGNKILCTRQSNRDKGNRTPFESWGHTERWAGIQERAERLPEHKRKLFREDALDVFLDGKDFLARHLTDTAYLGRAAKQYLTYICHKDSVWVSSGKLTGLIRGKFGLSRLLSEDGAKNRDDHRHHALDAAVIGLCSRSLIQRIATAAARSEGKGEQRLLEGLELPWPSFRDELAASLARVVVSHKPDHGKQAALHNDTNYAWRGAPDKRGDNPLVGRRRPLDSIKNASDAESIASEALRSEIVQLLAPLSSPKDIKAALLAYSERTGNRRVLCEERLSVIPIRHRRTGQPYRYVKGDGNHCYEIFRKPDGRWDGEVISTFEANQRSYLEAPTRAQNGLPLVMRIHKDDVLAMDCNGADQIFRVAKFSAGKIYLAAHKEANVDGRNRDPENPFRYLQFAPSKLREMRARIVGVDVLGYVNDPGFRE